MPEEASRPRVFYCHCGKSYARREHLNRHKANHNKVAAFVCPICQSQFRRNDLLRRHVKVHGKSAVVLHSRGVACDTCHASKTKCDGGQRCSLCTKREVDCTYERPGLQASQSTESTSSSTTVNLLEKERDAEHPTAASGTAPQLTVADSPRPWMDGSANPRGSWSVESAEVRHESPPQAQPNVEQQLLFSNVRLVLVLEAVSRHFAGTLEEQSPLWVQMAECMKRCAVSYQDGIHDFWPVLHAPSFGVEDLPVSKMACVIMFSCWLDNQEAASREIHELLVKNLLKRLVASDCDPQQHWPVDTWQVALVSIIFALQTGVHTNSRVIQLHGLLVTAVRQSGALNADNIRSQFATHYEGQIYPPWLFAMLESFKWIAICLFRVDVYLSLATGHPPIMQIEELDVELLSSYSLWNAHGLDVFFKRKGDWGQVQSQENRVVDLPKLIRATSHNIWHAASSGFRFLVAANATWSCHDAWPLENIELVVLATSSHIWHFARSRRSQSDSSASKLERDRLASQLFVCRYRLDVVKHILEERGSGSAEYSTYVKGYYTAEDWEDSAVPDSVYHRVSNMLLAVSMLHRLLVMHLCSDISTIRNLLKKGCTPNADSHVPNSSTQSQAQIREWARSEDGRFAVGRAFSAFRDYKWTQTSTQIRPENFAAKTTLSTAEEVVLAFVYYAADGCICKATSDSDAIIDLDECDWEGGKQQKYRNWFLHGGPVMFHAVPLCMCRVEAWRDMSWYLKEHTESLGNECRGNMSALLI